MHVSKSSGYLKWLYIADNLLEDDDAHYVNYFSSQNCIRQAVVLNACTGK